ncbi:hypothetical protein LSH36_1g11008 [Paralvinella palmiformis]|uniref:Neurexin/syndecan/glycophorin C domain-containing protein n=1 Tax=Paralvinella palmiformis TaxID=53620 RepID=A0AAD9KFI0_9ANNE|nr:hypothetical protein LSH36_1g11008 [Paralvinella palmiformis]
MISLDPIYFALVSFQTTPRGAGATDDIMFINPDCEEVDIEDCPDPDPNAFISPTVTMKSAKTRPTMSRLDYLVLTLGCVRHYAAASSSSGTTAPLAITEENADVALRSVCRRSFSVCGADVGIERSASCCGVDCLTGSGSGFIGEPASTPRSDERTDREHGIDIDVDRSGSPDRTTTDSPKIIIDVNMTEHPPRPDTRRPPTSTPPPTILPAGSGPGGGGDVSGLDPLKRGGTALGMNIGLIVGIAVGVVLLLLVIAFAFYKYKSRDEGSYKIDESKNYSYETCNTKPPAAQANGGMSNPID